MNAGAGASEFSYANPPWFCGSTNPFKHKGKVTAALPLAVKFYSTVHIGNTTCDTKMLFSPGWLLHLTVLRQIF